MTTSPALSAAARLHASRPTAAEAEAMDVEALLDRAQGGAFTYYEQAVDPESGLVLDSTQLDSPCSITAIGFALAAYPIAVVRGWMTRAQAVAITRGTLRFLHDADMSGSRHATGHRGFYYHFLDMFTGTRTWGSELSSIDTAFLVAGVRAAALWFDHDSDQEREIRDLAREIDERVDWRWMQNCGGAICHGWTPERGFLPYHWVGYSEALLMYALALGSPRHPVTASAYEAWTAGYRWKRIYGHEHLFAGPLFIHQYSHMFVDFRGIQDAPMRAKGLDYFENSRRATLVQREYAMRNPKHFDEYCAKCWGLTACDGPGPREITANGRRRKLLAYAARGAPYGPDDGTVAPYASVASLPFAPDVVLPTMRHIVGLMARHADYRPGNSFNPTWREGGNSLGWVSPWRFALNSGPVVLMIENHRSGMLWDLFKRCDNLRRGLARAGFRGGWLKED